MNKYTNKKKDLTILNKFMISLICCIFTMNISMVYSQDKTGTIQDKAIPIAQNSEIVNKIDGTPVLLGNTTLFLIQKNVGSFSHQERAQAVTTRLEKIANDPLISIDKLRVVEDSDTTKND